MNSKKEKTEFEILLVLFSIIIFVGTFLYFVSAPNLLNTHLVSDSVDVKIRMGLLVIEFLLAIVILYKKTFAYDVLSIILVYIVLSAIKSFYHRYLIYTNSNSKLIYYIDKYQDVNDVILLTMSLYILKRIFF